MKLLIMCEGPNEKEIINILLQNNCLKFTEDDLLGLTPYHARQIHSSAQVRTELNLYPGEVKIYRIGDKQSDKLKIPAEYKSKIISVEKYCTKPVSPSQKHQNRSFSIRRPFSVLFVPPGCEEGQRRVTPKQSGNPLPHSSSSPLRH